MGGGGRSGKRRGSPRAPRTSTSSNNSEGAATALGKPFCAEPNAARAVPLNPAAWFCWKLKTAVSFPTPPRLRKARRLRRSAARRAQAPRGRRRHTPDRPAAAGGRRSLLPPRDSQSYPRGLLGGERSALDYPSAGPAGTRRRSEEHTSELQSRGHLVCRLLLEKKKTDVRESDHIL